MSLFVPFGAKGEQINITNQVITLDSGVTIGHKIACQDIAAGEQILKYGVSIGSSTEAIKRANMFIFTHEK